MADKWVSTGLYEHPAKHQKGVYGNITQSAAGVYGLKVGGSHMSCPQDWAAKIHAEETEQDTKVIRIRNIPENIHTALKHRALDEGVSMEQLVLRWIVESLSKDAPK